MTELAHRKTVPEDLFRQALELIDTSTPHSEAEQMALTYRAGELIIRGLLPQLAVVKDWDHEDDEGLAKFDGLQTRVNAQAFRGQGLSVETMLQLYCEDTESVYPTNPQAVHVQLDALKGVLPGPTVFNPTIIKGSDTILGTAMIAGSFKVSRNYVDHHLTATYISELDQVSVHTAWDFHEDIGDDPNFDQPAEALDASTIRQLAFYLSGSTFVPPDLTFQAETKVLPS